MILYMVFRKDYEHRKGELLGVLVERRKDTRGGTHLESGLRWARFVFGQFVKDKKDIIVFPKEVEISDDTRLLVEKGMLTREEYLEMMEVLSREMKDKEKRES